ncbi:MAG: zinc ribbon domain-containing protein [Deltaproteobacteria bacterium]|nr:MAG: zinc ribbon domain-containing protein [Deltaproteobacteria bacterium]
MPIYEYRCDSCHQEFEAVQKITADPLDTCSLCGAPNPRKLISNSSFVLKGSGWYVTDYARKGNGAAKKGGKASTTESSGKESACSSGCGATAGTCAAD